ncbi:MAG: class I SAM-dependent methyltransferase [Actinomycetota bacterium]|nr:class I SAM-dependent methyltransferase [Actinomycetota bacterium]
MQADQRQFQQEYYDRHYPDRVGAVREQLVHPLFCSFYDRLAERVLDAGLEGRPDPTAPVRIFEVGCGEGFLGSAVLRVAARRGLKVDYGGADLSSAALELARPTLGDDLIVGDAEEVASGLPADSCDLFVVKNLLHHLEDPAALLREARRVVGENGRVVVIEARLGGPQFWVFTLTAPRRERYFFLGARRNRAALEAAGFSIVHRQRFSWLPYELFFHIRPGVFRRVFSTSDPAVIGRISALDDRLSAWLPWLTSYVVWVAKQT